MKLEEIIEFLNEEAPTEFAAEYDNVGLLAGRRDKEVHRILTALDCTEAVVCEAEEKKCDAIVCHHPIMFCGVKKITDETQEGQMLLYAMENRIAIFAAHTNLDFARGGLNDYFLEKLGYEASDTIEGNEGRVFEANTTVGELCEKIKKVFGVEHLRIAGKKDARVKKCAICTGSGKSLLGSVLKNADTYITGEMGHHDILTAMENGCNYIEISHYDSEKIAPELLKKKLCGKFPQLEVFESEKSKNPLTFV